MTTRILLGLAVLGAVVAIAWVLFGTSEPADRSEVVRPVEPEPPVEVDLPTPPEPEPVPDEPSGKGPPPDPVETGPCSLILEIKDIETNERVRTHVTLWRLEVPGNEHWTAGDQVQARTLAPNGMVRFDELPVGDYRVACEMRRMEGSDARVIQVAGEVTEETIAIHVPRRFGVYLKVFDLDGKPVTKGKILRRGESQRPTNREPHWLKPRRLRTPSNGSFRGRRGSRDLFQRPYDSTASDKGFYLGELEEDLLDWARTYRFELGSAGNTTVLAQIRGDFDGETTYVGLAVPLEPVASRIFMPDGQRADKNHARIRATTTAVPDAGPGTLDRLKATPVKVTATRNGFEDLEFQCPTDRPPDPRHMTRRTPPGG